MSRQVNRYLKDKAFDHIDHAPENQKENYRERPENYNPASDLIASDNPPAEPLDMAKVAAAIYDVMSVSDGVEMSVAERYATAALAALPSANSRPNGATLREQYEKDLTRIIDEWEQRREVCLADPEAKARFLILRSFDLSLATAPEASDAS